MSKCAYTVFNDSEEVLEKGVIRTGASNVKGKKPDVQYYDTVEEQIHYICEFICDIYDSYKPEVVIFEALSFGSAGNATRNLAQLYGALIEVLLTSKGMDRYCIVSYAPTTLKAFARKILPEEERYDGNTVAGGQKLVKMDKKLMVKAAETIVGKDYFKGYNFSTGKDDLADSFLLGYKYLKENP